jgi:tetratricopeptide (TPR) repeat protein
MSRRLAAFSVSILIGLVAAGAWWRTTAPSASDPPPEEAALPVPPFPPRITEGATYEACLATLANDPVSAVAIAENWQANGGDEGAMHCHGLALIAVGKPAEGAEELEQLAMRSAAPAMARAQVLGQAIQARLMASQPATAVKDATTALALSPNDGELMIMRATAEGQLNRYQDAVADLDAALRLDPTRVDALVARAVMRRDLNELDLAQADASRALALDPENQDALLERGILRQRLGDTAGARSDWERARGLDPNTTTADLAQQNLSLLEAGPPR